MTPDGRSDGAPPLSAARQGVAQSRGEESDSCHLEASGTMNTGLPPVVMTIADQQRLLAIARTLKKEAHPLAAALLSEICRAELRQPDEIPEGTVMLGSFVTYRTAGSERPERRLLIHPRDMMWPPAEISVATPLGITLLGLSAGDRMTVIGSDVGEPPWVEVVAAGGAAISGFARRPTFAYGESGAVVCGSPRIA